MSKIKEYMQRQIEEMQTALETFNIPLFEDEIAEDEEEKLYQNDYHCFVYETLDISNNDDLKSVTQTVAVYYYSENRDDLDERTVAIILSLKDVPGFSLNRTTKQRLQKKETDQFVDRVIFEYSRKIVTGCKV
ncbi:hypothetical protein H9650_20135 [Psychrobacillus sp. Sa2BUA9]|uniref:Phage protein n=1 Tax=Psychrobacillus faecigallinarum TaxID=2762235 RepID=A0ABR8RFA5_9BACI|nr:hypothetical protein [Psychrobacillus faecigallinarum]MBD7946409.1 hypothetical protein [Psychrobacillus faecigallinarum]